LAVHPLKEGSPGQVDDPLQIISPEQLSQILGVPEKTLERWRNHGTGPPFFRAGRHVRYRRDDVAKWIEQQIVDPREPESN
jgi:excisionase family DNA binding protein